jgi:hypothetical protein
MRIRHSRVIHTSGCLGVCVYGVSVCGVGGQSTRVNVSLGCVRDRRGGTQLVTAGRFYFITLLESRSCVRGQCANTRETSRSDSTVSFHTIRQGGYELLHRCQVLCLFGDWCSRVGVSLWGRN